MLLAPFAFYVSCFNSCQKIPYLPRVGPKLSTSAGTCMLLSVFTADQSGLQMAMQNFLIVYAHVVDFIHFVRHCVHIQVLPNFNEVKNMITQF